MRRIPVEDFEEGVLDQSAEVGAAVRDLLPVGTQFAVVAKIGGMSQVRLISNFECLTTTRDVLTKILDSLAGRKCYHCSQEDEADPCTAFIEVKDRSV